jgi:glutathionylspermidine synthase
MNMTLLPQTRPYLEFAHELEETCLVNDPYYEGRPIFLSAPIVLADDFVARLYREGERVGALFEELARIVWDEPALLDDFFHLPPHYKLMWLSSGGFWHGFARMDMFLLEDGRLQICELNADTPSGQVECLAPYPLLKPRYPTLRPLNEDLEERLWRLLCRVEQRRTGKAEPPRRVGIIYPTDLPEDITLIRLYQRFFQSKGCEVQLGSPFNLTRTEGGGVALFGTPIDVVLRHYKTDWWGERLRIFSDEDDVPDKEPLEDELFKLLDAEQRGKVSVVNPFGALLPQDKLSMAFMWQHTERFSPAGQQAIRDLIPETRRLDDLDREQLKSEREQWVLKSDFGCEGDEVLVGPNVEDEQWHKGLLECLPHMWVAQRYFQVSPLAGEEGQQWLPNFGVFLVGGESAGLLVRLAEKGVTTGHDARVVTPFLPALR